VVRCPHCDEDLRSIRRSCANCGEDLAAVAEADRAAGLAEATREDAAAGRFRHVPPEAFRRFRKGTIGWAATLAGCVVLILLGTSGDNNSPRVAFAVFGWIFGIVAFLCVLGFGVSDLLLTPPEKLTTPEKTLSTYLKCLREKRWEYAWSLGVPRARAGNRVRPAIEKIKVDKGEFTMSTPEGLAGYWTPLLRQSGGTTRTVNVTKVKAALSGPDDAIAGCTLKITGYPSWIWVTILASLIITVVLYVVLKKTEEVPVDMPLVRIDGRWYLLDLTPHIPTANA
jgi:uncharacterized integral membrane protein